MKFFLPFLMLIFISGCAGINESTQKSITENSSFENIQEHVSSNLNTTIIDIANQLFNSNYNKKTPIRIILTSFVDLNNLEKTTTFGRLISESMFNELHIRKFIISDFRGQNAVSVNEDGEFHITRDTEKLKENIESTEFILVGTYVKFENQSLLINARIVDSISGDVISSARAVYHPQDCNLFGICENIKERDYKMDTKYNIYDTETSSSNNTHDNFSIIPDNIKE